MVRCGIRLSRDGAKLGRLFIVVFRVLAVASMAGERAGSSALAAHEHVGTSLLAAGERGAADLLAAGEQLGTCLLAACQRVSAHLHAASHQLVSLLLATGERVEAIVGHLHPSSRFQSRSAPTCSQ